LIYWTLVSGQPLTAHTGNLRHSGKVYVRFLFGHVTGTIECGTWVPGATSAKFTASYKWLFIK